MKNKGETELNTSGSFNINYRNQDITTFLLHIKFLLIIAYQFAAYFNLIISNRLENDLFEVSINNSIIFALSVVLV